MVVVGEGGTQFEAQSYRCQWFNSSFTYSVKCILFDAMNFSQPTKSRQLGFVRCPSVELCRLCLGLLLGLTECDKS